jgi:hypothetical protein
MLLRGRLIPAATVFERDIQDHRDDDDRGQESRDCQQKHVVGCVLNVVLNVRLSLPSDHYADIPRQTRSSTAVTLL